MTVNPPLFIPDFTDISEVQHIGPVVDITMGGGAESIIPRELD